MPTGVRGKVHPHKTKNHITRRVEVARYLSEGNKKQNLIHISTPGASGPGKCHTASLHFPAAISIIITAISFGGFVQHNLHVGSYRPHEGLVVVASFFLILATQEFIQGYMVRLICAQLFATSLCHP